MMLEIEPQNVTSDPTKIANALNDYVASVYLKSGDLDKGTFTNCLNRQTKA